MTKTRFLVLASVVSCGLAQLRLDVTPGRETTFATQIVPAAQFTQLRLMSIGETAMKGSHGLFSIWFSTSVAEQQALLSKIVVIDGDPYGSWLYGYESARSRQWNVGRFLAWDGSAILLMRDRNGTISRRVVRESDFLTIAEDGVFASIVDLGVTADPQLELTIFARTYGRLETKTVDTIWRRFHSVSAHLVSIDLRSDPWFIDHETSLLLNPFESSPPPPSHDEAEKLRSLLCTGSPRAAAPTCVCQIRGLALADLDLCLR